MTAELNVNAGDTLATAQISPCIGGLVRTWVDGEEPRLWATPDADWLLHTQGTGQAPPPPRRPSASSQQSC